MKVVITLLALIAPALAEDRPANPVCNICRNGQYPGKPYTITTVAYIEGNPTCRDLWFMGNNKEIHIDLCYPLQLFMRGPCGCDLPPGPGAPYPSSISPTNSSYPTSPSSFSSSSSPSFSSYPSSSSSSPLSCKKSSKSKKVNF